MSNDTELPTEAHRKILAIESALQDYEDAKNAAGRRLQQLNPRSSDPAIGEALQEKRDKAGQKHDELNVLANRIRQWLRALPPNTVLEAAPPVWTKPKEGETIAAAVVRVRREILTCKQDLAAARNAPLPSSDLKKLIAARVQRMASNGAPNLTVDGGKGGPVGLARFRPADEAARR
jgi:hypothetical protein